MLSVSCYASYMTNSSYLDLLSDPAFVDALAAAVWSPAHQVRVGQVTVDRGVLWFNPVLLGDGLARFEFELESVVLPLDCDLPVVLASS